MTVIFTVTFSYLIYFFGNKFTSVGTSDFGLGSCVWNQISTRQGSIMLHMWGFSSSLVFLLIRSHSTKVEPEQNRLLTAIVKSTDM